MEEEVILNKIIEDANKEASKITEEAQKRAKEIEEKDQEQISNKTEVELEAIRDEIKIQKENEIEEAELKSRNTMLTKKQEQIKIVKEKVKQKIRDLSVEELCNIYKNMISKMTNLENLEIIIQENNKEKISKELETLGVKISNEALNYNYGIIIRDGKIEYNGCFEEIMKFNNEQIEKQIANILFS